MLRQYAAALCCDGKDVGCKEGSMEGSEVKTVRFSHIFIKYGKK